MLNTPTDGVAFLRDITVKYSDGLSSRTNVAVRVDLTILDDVFYTAATSVKFHNIKPSSVNHYKQSAHLGFWFQKFKPLRYIAPPDTRMLFKHAFDNFEALIFGNQGKFETDYISANADYEKVKGDPINEWVALLIIKTMIGSAQKLAAARLPAQERIIAEAAIDDVHARFELQIKELTNGLRYHNFSARGFATMIEHMFKVSKV